MSIEAQQVFNSLDGKTKKVIQGNHPFKKLRNEAIADLGKKGINGRLLAEITSLSTSSVSRILGTGGQTRYKPDRREVELWKLKEMIDGLYKRYRRFILARDERRGKRACKGRRKKS
jgi:hypothetical protein